MGIDLGTTYSCVAVYKNGKSEVIPNDMGHMTTPSMVCFKDGERLVGDAARNAQLSNPSQTVYDSKRLIGRIYKEPDVQNDIQHWPFCVIEGDKGVPKICVTEDGKKVEFFPEQISAMILRKLAACVETNQRKKITKAVITVPAYFNNTQRETTKLAGKIAGLDVIGIINEPTAAAIAYGFQDNSKSKNILVYDIGGGTLDVTILKLNRVGRKTNFDVIATKGNIHLGGEDFDQALLEVVLEKLLKKGTDFSTNNKAKQTIRRNCEEAKKRLTAGVTTNIEFSFDGTSYSIPLTRDEFDFHCDDLMSQCTEPLQEALDQAGLTIDNIENVILVGGSSRIPSIKEMVEDFFEGKKAFYGLNPDEAVAQGAAIYAAKLLHDEDGDDDDGGYISLIEISDIIPFPIGTKLVGDRFFTIVPEKSKYPGHWENSFFTVVANQSLMVNEVREGYSETASENHLLDKFTITDIPPGPAGSQKVIDKYDIDKSGILVVTSVVVSSGISKSLTIKRESYQHTDEELNAMKMDHEKYVSREREISEKAAKLDEMEAYVNDKIKERKGKYDEPDLRKLLIEVKDWISENRQVSLREIQNKFDEYKRRIANF